MSDAMKCMPNCACGRHTRSGRRGQGAWNTGRTAADDSRIASGVRLAHRPPPVIKGKILAAVPRYEAIHYRLDQLRTGVCARCEHKGRTDMSLLPGRGHLTNGDGPRANLQFSDDLNDYVELCHRCHCRMDRGCDE